MAIRKPGPGRQVASHGPRRPDTTGAQRLKELSDPPTSIAAGNLDPSGFPDRVAMAQDSDHSFVWIKTADSIGIAESNGLGILDMRDSTAFRNRFAPGC